MRVKLSQLTCLYQFDFVMGVSVMCDFLESYLVFRLGSEGFAMGVGWEEEYSGLTARWPAVGCDEGISTSQSRNTQSMVCGRYE